MPIAERGAVGLTRMHRSSLRRVLWTFGLLLPLALAACGGSTAHVTHNAPVATATTTLPAAKGIYFNTYDETTANGQQTVINNAIVALNPADGAVRWKVTSPPHSSPSLVATDRVVYALGDQIQALRASDGSQLWSHPGVKSAVYGNGVVYAMSCNGNADATCSLSSLDGLTGATRWTTPNLPHGDLKLAGTDILVSAVNLNSTDVPDSASLDALDINTGKQLWHVAEQDGGFFVAGWHSDQLYLLHEINSLPTTNRIQAVRLADGAQLWETSDIPQYIHITEVDSVRIYVQTRSGMQALNEADGSVAWSYTGADFDATKAAMAKGVIYMPLLSGTIVALDAATGKTLNSTPFNVVNLGFFPVVANGLIYLNSMSADGSRTTYFNALDTSANFAQRWSQQGAFQTAVVSNGTLFATDYAASTAPDTVYAINATTGALLWKYSVGHMVAIDWEYGTLVVVN